MDLLFLLLLLAVLIPASVVASQAATECKDPVHTEESAAAAAEADADAELSCKSVDSAPPPPPPPPCGLFLAQSTIPNAGLGMFVGGMNHERGSVTVAPPEIAHQMILDFPESDESMLFASPDYSTTLLHAYTWNFYVTGGSFESLYADSLTPGLGMAANSFPPMVNVRSIMGQQQQQEEPIQQSQNINGSTIHHRRGPGAGAYSAYFNVTYVAEEALTAGSELFVDYGDAYFRDRPDVYGMMPLQADFAWADGVLRKLWRALNLQHLETATTAAATAIKKNMSHSDDDDDRNDDDDDDDNNDDALFSNQLGQRQAAWEALLTEHLEDERRRNALPSQVSEVPRAVRIGTARNYLRGDNPRSVEWLQTHGYCMDHAVTVRPSRIPHAGRGAFAKRSLQEGERILPFPLLQVPRRALHIYRKEQTTENDSEEQATITLHSHQLLLNYCFGHQDSSLLLIPYSSTSQFINHASTAYAANAKLVWATSDGDPTNFHRDEWWNMSAQYVLDQDRAGLLMHLVATREIAEGEEITMDYGPRWAEAWARHEQEWRRKEKEEEEEYVSASQLNDSEKEIRTVFDNERQYPSNVATACHYRFGGTRDAQQAETDPIVRLEDGEAILDQDDALTTGLDAPALEKLQRMLPDIERRAPSWRETGPRYFSGDSLRPCKIVARHTATTTTGEDHYYLVRVFNRWDQAAWDRIPTESMEHYVKNVPRRAILFVDRPYTSNQHLPGAFRHELGFPDDSMWPLAWRDEAS